MIRTSLFVVFVAACGGTISTAGDSGAPPDGAITKDANLGSCPSSCGPTEYCKLDRTCGSKTGACAPRPTACPKSYSPVCGIDGTVYGNECAANAAGVDITDIQICKPPQALMACGSGFCDATSSYCQTIGNDVISPGTPCGTYVCKPLPPTCVGKSDCACFPPTTPCSSHCKFDGNGLVLMCVGG